tara:strand:+ start:248 stop:523 length:276 start_codon:yes stop_codon:yes gene_type:complete
MPEQFRLLSGTLLLVKDPDRTMDRGLHLPDIMHIRACTGRVLMHEQAWLDEDMTGQRIVYAKFSEREVPFGEHMFAITEDSVMAVLEGEVT